MNGLQLRLLRCMQDAEAPYLVIGGFAIRALGIDRATVDLDIVTSTVDVHAAATYAALIMFDARFAGNFKPGQLALRDKRIVIPSQHGKEVDLLTSVGDFDFDDLAARKFVVQAKGIDIAFASAADQLAIKRVSLAAVEKDIAAGVPAHKVKDAHAAREKDIRDITLLEGHLASA